MGLIILAGPTASGKSALALRIAEVLDGVIINADSMQLYADLHVLTARPGPEEEARVPHRLYGVLDAGTPASAGLWLELVATELHAAAEAGCTPVVVGGTGLYLHALIHGLAPVPDIPPQVRTQTRARFAQLGGARFRDELAVLDPLMAARLRPSDAQRLMRAYEVVAGTGRSLAAWQEQPRLRVPLPEPWRGIALLPPRAALYERIGQRLRQMVAGGALEEVARLASRGLDPGLPIMKALAVPELLTYLRGAIDLEAALDRAITQTRRYAKRQLTWLRHRLPEFERIESFGDAPDTPFDLAQLRAALLTGAETAHSVQRTI